MGKTASKPRSPRSRTGAAESDTAPSAPDSAKLRTVILLSGGTGRTADAVLSAALAQFPDPRVRVVRKVGVGTSAAAKQIVQQAAKEDAVIIHTLVSPKVRETITRETNRRNIPTVDILGPVLNAMADHLQLPPRNKPGLSYELQKESFDRIDAVDYTLTHDDGVRLGGLAEADVVLVGTSRVAKSVTCFYLAYRGIRAANVPLIRGHETPSELVKLDPRKVVALIMNAQRLQSIRSVRSGHIGAGQLDHYTGRDSIVQEIRHVNDLVTKYHWCSIDVSYMAVEEVAKEVTELVGLV